MAEGMKVMLSALPGGLTVDRKGRKLLEQPFVFQCPPLDEFKVVHAFSFGNYDTIEEGQFTRRGSMQLRTWQFDTLVMEVGVTEDGSRPSPGWVPFHHSDSPGRPVAPQWYINQLDKIHDAGAPFRFSAQFAFLPSQREAAYAISPVVSRPAVLLGFTEGHKHGEGDAIYLESVSFSEWRDPTESQRGLGKNHGHPADAPPTSVKLLADGTARTRDARIIPHQPRSGVKQVTLVELSKYFFHTPQFWRIIYDANKLKGGAGNTPLIKFPKYQRIPHGGATVKIPALSSDVQLEPTSSHPM